MKRSLKERFLSFATAMAMGLSSVSLGSVSIVAEDSDSSATDTTLFSLDGTSLSGSWLGANDLYTRIDFQNVFKTESVIMTIPQNTYYLLVHAVGNDNTMTGFTYESGEDNNHYQLIEIDTDGAETWNSGKFNVLPAKSVTDWSGTHDALPATASVEGTILKNDDPSSELTLENAISGTGCSAVTDIEGAKLVSQGLSGQTDSWANNTIVVSAQSGYGVQINVYDYDGSTPAVLTNDTPSQYFTLAYLTPKGEGSSRENVQGWAIQPFDPQSNVSTSQSFTTFYPFGEDGSSKEGTMLNYDPELYDVSIRVYRADEPLETYDDCVKKGVDSIPDYRFASSKDGNLTTLSIIKDIVEYHVDIQADAPVTITEDDHVYLYINVKHESTGDTYYYQPVTMAELPELIVDVEKWMNGNGNIDENEKFRGNETLSVSLVISTQEINLNNITSQTNCSFIQEGDNLKSFTVHYGDRKKTRDESTYVTVYTDYIYLTSVSATHDYDFKTILGDSLYYGITADRFNQTNHAQTNAAANYYQSNNNPIEPDLSGKSSGAFWLPYFVNFNGKTVFDDETTIYEAGEEQGKIFIGQSHNEYGIVLNVDSETRLQDPRDFVTIKTHVPQDMVNNPIEPMIKHMEQMSDELLRHSSNVTPMKVSQNEVLIDTTAFADDVTLYIDGDTLADLMNGNIGGGLKIKKKEGQMLVFNFDSTESLTLGRAIVEIYDEDGNMTDSGANYGASDTENGSATNQWLDRLTRHIVWNLSSVKEVDLEATSGIFLLPDENSVATVTGTSTGWIVTDGYLTNPSGEWHFVYSELPDAGSEKTATVLLE